MSENTTSTTKKTWLDKALTVVENVCNKLPDPVILFCWLFLFTAIIGTIATVAGVSLINPATNEAVVSQNFFSVDGLHWVLDNMVKNFTGFAPLGLVITMTLGIGICEESGMLISMLNSSLKNVPAAMIPYVIAFVGTVRYRNGRYPADGCYRLHGRWQTPGGWYDGWLRRCSGRFHSEPDGCRY
mgnify:CR=1 FL=1